MKKSQVIRDRENYSGRGNSMCKELKAGREQCQPLREIRKASCVWNFIKERECDREVGRGQI